MNKFTQVVKNFWNDEEGLTAVEYAVAGSLVTAAVVAAFTNLGAAVSSALGNLRTAISA